MLVRIQSSPQTKRRIAIYCILWFHVRRFFISTLRRHPGVCLGKVAHAMDGTISVSRSSIAGNIAIHNCLSQTSGVENPGYY